MTQPLTFRIHHVMLPVADLDRAIDFYTRVMGMTQFSRKSFPKDQTENAMVAYGTPPGPPMIELIKDMKSTTVPELANHVAIQVNDLKTLYAALQAEGLTVKEPFAARADGKGYGARVFDRDGHEVQLMQLD